MLLFGLGGLKMFPLVAYGYVFDRSVLLQLSTKVQSLCLFHTRFNIKYQKIILFLQEAIVSS